MTAQIVFDPNATRPPSRDPIVDALLEATPVATTIERLAHLRGLPGRKPGAYALHETATAARPALLAALHRKLGGTLLRRHAHRRRRGAHCLRRLIVLSGRRRTDDDRAASFARRSRRRDRKIPSERSARMTLLARALARRTAHRSGADRRRTAIRHAGTELFAELRFEARTGDEPGWEAFQERLYRLGYTRVDVVSAAGEYAVRGGIVDLFAASEPLPTRIEFFGDQIDSIRQFGLESQRTQATVDRVEIVPWNQIPRDDEYRSRVLEQVRRSATRASRVGDRDCQSVPTFPRPWLPLAFERPATIFDYLQTDGVVVLDEPATIATRSPTHYDRERTHEQHVLLADVESGELPVDESRVGEAMLAEIGAAHPSLDDLASAASERATLIVSGSRSKTPGSRNGRRPCSNVSRWSAARPNTSTARSNSFRVAYARRSSATSASSS